jgi:hypothetical protein
MSWQPNDLVSDADLIAYERTILSQFGQDSWTARRQKAIEDWLFPLLEGHGFDPSRFRTRFIADAVVANSTDITDQARADDGLNVAALLASTSDALYVGSSEAFRGLSIRQVEQANTVDSVLAVTLWTDAWSPAPDLADQTKIGNRSLGAGGSITWRVPEGLVRRTLAGRGPYYWVRLKISAAPTGCVIGPIAVIRRSRLCAAVTYRTLSLIFREAPIAQDGPWLEKATWYEQEAERAWLRVADRIGGEFDSDDDDAISPAEAEQTAASVNGGGWTFERC